MNSIRAVIIDHNKANHVTLGHTTSPIAQASQAIIQVAAISLNPGDFFGASVGWKHDRQCQTIWSL